MKGPTTGVWVGLVVMALGQVCELLGVHLTDAATQQTAIALVSLGAGAVTAISHHWHPGGGAADKQGGFARVGMLVMLALAAGAVLGLGACSTLPGVTKQTWNADGSHSIVGADYNPSEYAGCTFVDAVITPPNPPGGHTDVHWKDCKDKADVAANIDFVKGTMTYDAHGVNGSTAYAMLSSAHSTMANAAKDAAPAVASGVVDAILAGLGKPPGLSIPAAGQSATVIQNQAPPAPNAAPVAAPGALPTVP